MDVSAVKLLINVHKIIVMQLMDTCMSQIPKLAYYKTLIRLL